MTKAEERALEICPPMIVKDEDGSLDDLTYIARTWVQKGYEAAQKDLSWILDTLSEEPDKDLEKEFELQFDSLPQEVLDRQSDGGIEFYDKLYAFSRHFVKWQKEQMLKGAMEGEVHPDDCEIWVNLVGYGYKFNDGDKVRIIVLPKED